MYRGGNKCFYWGRGCASFREAKEMTFDLGFEEPRVCQVDGRADGESFPGGGLNRCKGKEV